MEKGFSEFDLKRKSFYEKLKTEDIHLFMYELGVRTRSYHHTLNEKSSGIFLPYEAIFKPRWDMNVWSNVTWGLDDTELDTEQKTLLMDKGLLSMPYYDYLISGAIKYNRPVWAIFGLIGMMQGSLNQNKFPLSNREDVLDEEDFVRCLRYIPTYLLQHYKKDLEYLFSYFDEINYRLAIDAFGNVSIGTNHVHNDMPEDYKSVVRPYNKEYNYTLIEFTDTFTRLFSFLETNGFIRTRLHTESNLFYKFEYSKEKVKIEFIYELREDLFDATIEKNDRLENKHFLHNYILRYEPGITRSQLQPTIGNWYEPLRLFATLLERHLSRVIRDVESN